MPETTEQIDHKAEALRLLEAARERAEGLFGDRIPPDLLLQAAVAYSNLALADEATPHGVANGDLTRWILDALGQPADDPTNTEASRMQARIDTAIRGWFDV